MQERISTPFLFFTIFFTSSPLPMFLSILSPPHSSLPSPTPNTPLACALQSCWSQWDGTAKYQGSLTPHTIRSCFHPLGLQLLTATADWTVWGTFSWTVQSLPGPRLWKIQGLAHTIPLWRLFSETLHCLWQQGKDGAPSVFLLLLWISAKFAIRSTKVAELSEELTAARMDGPAPPSPLLCPLLRVHCDASASQFIPLSNRKLFSFLGESGHQPSESVQQRMNRHTARTRAALAVAASTQIILGSSCQAAKWKAKSIST